MSRGQIGVADIAWKTWFQLKPRMIGNIDSNAAVCIGVAARSPRQEIEVRHAAQRRAVRHVAPSPSPIAVRNRPGDGTRRRSRHGKSVDRARADARRPGRASNSATRARSRPQSMRLRPVRRRKTSSSEIAGRDGRRAQPALVHGDQRGVAVVGVEQDPVGEALDALGDAVELAVGASSSPGEADLDHLAGRVLLDQLAWAPSATILALSMTTSRSQSCSASSM